MLGAVALVAVATILGATAAAYAFDLAEFNQPAPNVVESRISSPGDRLGGGMSP